MTLDVAGGTGTVDIVVDIASVDFGNEELNAAAANSTAPAILEAAKYPTAHYTGTLGSFINGAPTVVTGKLTLHGITQPLVLSIGRFKCIFNRGQFGISVGRMYGFHMDVTLRIQVEAIRTTPQASP